MSSGLLGVIAKTAGGVALAGNVGISAVRIDSQFPMEGFDRLVVVVKLALKNTQLIVDTRQVGGK